MQNNKRNCIAIISLALLFGSVSYAQDSIQTVDALLDAENKAVVERLKAVREALAPPKAIIEKKAVKKGPASFQVNAVYGLSENIKTDLNYEGQSYIGASMGGQIGPCKISAVRGMCVSLASTAASNPQGIGDPLALSSGESLVNSKKSESKNKSSKAHKTNNKKQLAQVAIANMCPTSCWSAPAPTVPVNRGGNGLGVFPGAGELPRFSPPVLTGNQRPSEPVVMSAMGLGALMSQPQSPIVSLKPIGDLRLTKSLSGMAN